ncbi:transposase family protein [Actinoplanes sp. NPDC048796]|uniref:transposase family protein n=1 Tax=Actinoplanes sp. NPDC048796 TaxID=3155640 RepID=UPI00340FB126
MERSEAGLQLWASVRDRTAVCPTCGTATARVHGRYLRQLTDTPVAGQPTRILCGCAASSAQTPLVRSGRSSSRSMG